MKLDDKKKILEALLKKRITKEEAKDIFQAGKPNDYFYLDTDKEDKEEYQRIKELMERVGFFPKLKFENDD